MEDKLEFVREKIANREQTLPEIATGAKVSLRTLGYIVSGNDQIRLVTLNRLYSYLKGKKK